MTATTATITRAETHPRRSWVSNATLLWKHRTLLARITAIALVISLGIAFVIPKRYESSARIMPPDQGGTGTLMLAALAARAGALGGLSSLFSGHSTTALFVDLLHSGTVRGHLIERFQLQHVYRKRYLVDTAKELARRTTVSDDKKSGVITITVSDHDPARARDLAQGYLDELNNIVTQTSTSSAHQERIFIERRLRAVQSELESAQLALSEFSSTHTTVDIKEQTRAMVDAGARLEAEMLTEQSGLDSLRQIYGDGNVRVREAEARIASLQHDLLKMRGTSASLPTDSGNTAAPETSSDELYPALRQLPRLAVPYADLYRRVKVQETVYELLTQQYEMARIQEAKDVPVVSVIDPPGLPEKKSFPPRLVVALLLTVCTFMCAATVIVFRERWSRVALEDPRKALANEIAASIRAAVRRGFPPNEAMR